MNEILFLPICCQLTSVNGLHRFVQPEPFYHGLACWSLHFGPVDHVRFLNGEYDRDRLWTLVRPSVSSLTFSKAIMKGSKLSFHNGLLMREVSDLGDVGTEVWRRGGSFKGKNRPLQKSSSANAMVENEFARAGARGPGDRVLVRPEQIGSFCFLLQLNCLGIRMVFLVEPKNLYGA
ncbi:hypothetical protein L6452_08919 [Arctium lappa]|uniref:Uncharacterized protein n=1 Tax=Arctium lappa TaxID=4217 RepID=A0ACB9DJ93_ARCLA|nr:hypothetical protein L6452_08919 [Arctium lappa]